MASEGSKAHWVGLALQCPQRCLGPAARAGSHGACSSGLVGIHWRCGCSRGARGAAALLSLSPQSPAGDSRPTEPRLTGSALLSQRLHGLVPHGLAHEAPVTCLPLRGPQGRCHLCELLPFRTPAGLGLPRQDRPPLGTQCVSSRLCGPCLRLGPWGQHCPHPGPHPGLDWSPWDIPPLPRRCRRS